MIALEAEPPQAAVEREAAACFVLCTQRADRQQPRATDLQCQRLVPVTEKSDFQSRTLCPAVPARYLKQF